MLLFGRHPDVSIEPANNPLMEETWGGGHVQDAVDDFVTIAIVGKCLPIIIRPMALRRTIDYDCMGRNHQSCHRPFPMSLCGREPAPQRISASGCQHLFAAL